MRANTAHTASGSRTRTDTSLHVQGSHTFESPDAVVYERNPWGTATAGRAFVVRGTVSVRNGLATVRVLEDGGEGSFFELSLTDTAGNTGLVTLQGMLSVDTEPPPALDGARHDWPERPDPSETTLCASERCLLGRSFFAAHQLPAASFRVARARRDHRLRRFRKGVGRHILGTYFDARPSAFA